MLEKVGAHGGCEALKAAAVFALASSFAAGASAEEVAVPGGVIDLQFTTSPPPGLREVAAGWILSSASAVAKYYGGAFPVRRAELRITPRDGREAKGGTAYGWNGPLITIGLGRAAARADLADDWLLPHEMLHLGFPSLAERHSWLEEGLATYIEPIARARAGLLTPERAWSDLANGLPQGQPEADDRGLDFTPTWGRKYWGGALFCLRADFEIRRRTQNRRGLEHVVRAAVAAGGTIEADWRIERVLIVGDGATGTTVLRELYDEMKATPVTVDLAAIWKQLGIVRRGRSVSFDDTAPFAEIRKAITGG